MPNCKFYGGRKSDDESLFLSLNLSAVLKKSTPGKFAHTCHFQQIGKTRQRLKKREFIWKPTFPLPLPLPSSMLKLPTAALLRTVKMRWRNVRPVQIVCIANSLYSEYIRSVHLIIISGHSVLRFERSVCLIDTVYTSRDFVARGRPLRGQTTLAPLDKRSTCSKSRYGRKFLVI